MPPEQLRSNYARLHDFIQLSQKYDPTGKLRNEFLNTNIFS
jgi:xylitol oxidase